MYKKFIKMKKYTITEGEYDLLCAKLQSLENENIRLKGYIKGIKEQLRIGGVSGSFCSDTNEDNKKILTGILYKHTDEKSMVIREIDYEEVINDIMEYF